VVIGIVLTLVLVSAGLSRFDLSIGMRVAITLGIAVFQVALSAAYFMHLNAEKSLVYGFLLLTGLFLMLLMFLPLLTESENTGKRLETGPAKTGAAHAEGAHVP
jgi:heme/copper-type cytochrome/quinol oxidase subunit 4